MKTVQQLIAFKLINSSKGRGNDQVSADFHEVIMMLCEKTLDMICVCM